jgi:hypothetical protein
VFPSELFALYPPFSRDQRVFVAISFDPVFMARWQNVIQPAIVEIGLEPFRMDVSKISDSILTEILRAIAQSRLIMADVTAVSEVRNGNVMYEVGLAHAVRQPQEVLLFRSDNERLLFDMANVRVNYYSPDTDIAGSKDLVKETLKQAMNEIDTRKSLAVQRAAGALDQNCFDLLIEAANGSARYPKLKTTADYLSSMPKILALSRLLELGLLMADYPKFSVEDLQRGKMDLPLENLMTYRLTPLGDAVFGEFGSRLGFDQIAKDPAKRQVVDELFAKYDSKKGSEEPTS